MSSNRITPDNITQIKDGEIFVFGSNERGGHFGGAARTALQWGAQIGRAEGLQGQTYAIPTKDGNIQYALPISRIKLYVDRFISFAKEHPELTFLVTPIGTGLSGISAKLIAPLFKDAIGVENIALPALFLNELK